MIQTSRRGFLGGMVACLMSAAVREAEAAAELPPP